MTNQSLIKMTTSDTYETLVAQIKKQHGEQAKLYIPKLCSLLLERYPDWKNKDIVNRIRHDLGGIWSRTAIYQNIPSKVKNKQKQAARLGKNKKKVKEECVTPVEHNVIEVSTNGVDHITPGISAGYSPPEENYDVSDSVKEEIKDADNSNEIQSLAGKLIEKLTIIPDGLTKLDIHDAGEKNVVINRRIAEASKPHLRDLAEHIPDGHIRSTIGAIRKLLYLMEIYEQILSDEIIARKRIQEESGI